MKKDRVPELHFYEWRISAWALSETRDRLDAAGRGIYRELLDCCYGQGQFPDDREWIIRRCACTPEEYEKTWPLIAKYFPVSKSAGYRLNLPANIVRREYFSYVSGQKKRRHEAIKKAKESKGMEELAPSKHNSRNELGATPVIPRTDLTATATATLHNGNGKKPVEPAVVDFEGAFERIYKAHPYPGQKGDSRRLWCGALESAVHPETVALSIEQSHTQWCLYWKQNSTSWKPTLSKWIEDEYYLKETPKVSDSLPKSRQQENADAWERA